MNDRSPQSFGFGVDPGDEAPSSARVAESERRHRELLERLREGVWAIDAEGKTTFVNASMARMLGYDVEEMRGRHLFSFMDEEGVAISKRNMERRAAGIAEQHEFVLRAKDGRRVETLMETSPLTDEHGNYVGAVAGVLDITALRTTERERAKLERKLLETQRLESLGQLAGGIAHDFNNILTSILGHATLAKDSGDPADAEVAFEAIEASARRAAEMCRQLLAYSGKGRFAVSDLDVSGVVRDATELLRISTRRDALLRFELADDLPRVSGDPSQILQVVMNLVVNASEALLDERAGTIMVRTGRLEVTSAYIQTYDLHHLAPGEHVFLEVSDDGRGMTKEQIARIFDPFYTTKFTGRGLGLSAVLGIVRGHRGEVRVYSEPGRGTSFRVLLPTVPDRAASTPPQPTSRTGWGGGGLVLVVDDEEAVRGITARLVTHQGFRTISAADGAEGVELFRRHAHELVCVLLDLTMPVKDGEAAFREMRELRPEIPVVLMSGFSEQEAVARFIGRGLAGFVQKPFDAASLVARLRAALEP